MGHGSTSVENGTAEVAVPAERRQARHDVLVGLQLACLQHISTMRATTEHLVKVTELAAEKYFGGPTGTGGPTGEHDEQSAQEADDPAPGGWKNKLMSIFRSDDSSLAALMKRAQVANDTRYDGLEDQFARRSSSYDLLGPAISVSSTLSTNGPRPLREGFRLSASYEVDDWNAPWLLNHVRRRATIRDRGTDAASVPRSRMVAGGGQGSSEEYGEVQESRGKTCFSAGGIVLGVLGTLAVAGVVLLVVLGGAKAGHEDYGDFLGGSSAAPAGRVPSSVSPPSSVSAFDSGGVDSNPPGREDAPVTTTTPALFGQPSGLSATPVAASRSDRPPAGAMTRPSNTSPSHTVATLSTTQPAGAASGFNGRPPPVDASVSVHESTGRGGRPWTNPQNRPRWGSSMTPAVVETLLWTPPSTSPEYHTDWSSSSEVSPDPAKHSEQVEKWCRIAKEELKEKDAAVFMPELPPHIVRDSRIALCVLESDGLALKFFPPSVQRNEALVKAAVRNNGMALEFALRRAFNTHPSWRSIVASAVSNDGRAFSLLTNEEKRSLAKDPLMLSAILAYGKGKHSDELGRSFLSQAGKAFKAVKAVKKEDTRKSRGLMKKRRKTRGNKGERENEDDGLPLSASLSLFPETSSLFGSLSSDPVGGLQRSKSLPELHEHDEGFYDAGGHLVEQGKQKRRKEKDGPGTEEWESSRGQKRGHSQFTGQRGDRSNTLRDPDQHIWGSFSSFASLVVGGEQEDSSDGDPTRSDPQHLPDTIIAI